MKETLIVEFGVEKTIQRDYGYEEKHLTFKGESTPYKAILKDGKLVAIVSKRYKLIENEKVIEVCKKIKDNFGFKYINVIDNFPRVHIHMTQESGDGVIVHNSVDGSFALRVDLSVRVQNNGYTIVRTNEIREMYRKHIGDVTLETLPTIIGKVLEFKDSIKSAIQELEKYTISQHKELLEDLEKVLPKKYIRTVIVASKTRPMTLRELYEITAQKIWNAKIDMKRKIRLFEQLNKLILLPIVLR